MKPIRLSNHALRYCQTRGFTAEEVEQAIRQAPWTGAREGRLECSLDVPYNRMWNGRRYATKRIRAIFVEGPDAIVVVTVIICYMRRNRDENRLRP
jgi:hypothetical protein